MEDHQKPRSVLEILETFGKFHVYHWTLATLPAFVVTMVNINFVFIAGDLEYRCRIPECDTPESTHHPPIWWPNTTIINRCSKPIVIENIPLENGTCSNNSFTGELARCTEWIYENNNTIVSELNLGCEPWKANLVGTVHNLGMLLSMVLVGWSSDRFGRKPTLILCAVSSAVGLLKAFSVNYYMFVIIEFVEGFVSGGMYLSSSVMLIEFCGTSQRLYAGILIAYVTYFGEIVFAGLAILFPYWKTLVKIIYSIPFIFISYIFLIRESPRWQLLNGKSEEAKRTLEIIARMNKIPVNNKELKDIDEARLKLAFNIKNYDVKEGFKDIIRSKEILKRLIIVCICRFTSSFIYYGITINSVFLPGDKYTNFFLSTFMSFPGELIALYTMKKFGRKIPLICGYLICGAMCIASSYVSSTWGRITCYLVGKMFIAACFTGVLTYTMELYPTSTRGTLMSCNSVASRTGAMVAPLTPMMYPISPVLPTVMFGISAVVSSLLLTQSPETKDVPLSDTIEQVERQASADKEEKRARKIGNYNSQSCETVVTHM